RLRANALATTSSPAGLLSLEAAGDANENVTAEAFVWIGSAPRPGEPAPGDVLVIAVRARTDDARLYGTLGRFVATLGALRPIHVDGAAGRAQLPYRLQLEAFAGIPVVPRGSEARSWD